MILCKLSPYADCIFLLIIFMLTVFIWAFCKIVCIFLLYICWRTTRMRNVIRSKIRLNQMKLYRIVSYRIVSSHRIASHRIASHRIASHRISSHLISSYPILSYLILSYLILSYLILSYLILCICQSTMLAFRWTVWDDWNRLLLPLAVSMSKTVFVHNSQDLSLTVAKYVLLNVTNYSLTV